MPFSEAPLPPALLESAVGAEGLPDGARWQLSLARVAAAPWSGWAALRGGTPHRPLLNARGWREARLDAAPGTAPGAGEHQASHHRAEGAAAGGSRAARPRRGKGEDDAAAAQQQQQQQEQDAQQPPQQPQPADSDDGSVPALLLGDCFVTVNPAMGLLSM
ncbi:MAG: hypothetical protein J3K34DRAFT_460697, partial [Monoraphidium minutum]